jgi:hypothetical protein
LQQQGLAAVHDAGHTMADRRAARRFHADEARARVHEAGEGARGVRAAADARHDDVGVGAEDGAYLRARFFAHDALELAHHPRIGMRTHDRAEAVVTALDVGHPVAHRFVDGVLERAAA